MRITFIIPHAGLSGGIRVVATYAKLLKHRGHDVVVVSRPLPKPTMFKKIRSLIGGNIESLNVDQEPSHFEEINIPHIILDSCRPISNADVPDGDIVIATWWETAEWVEALSPTKGTKVYFVQGDDRKIVSEINKKRVNATLQMPMHKITISKWLLEMLLNEFGSTRVSLVSNAVDLQQFYSPPRGKQPELTVGFVYSEAIFKGCDISIAALHLVKKHVPTLKILAFGVYKPSQDLQLPHETIFQLRPKQTDLKTIYGSCDTWLFGSRCEGFGLPILEAMACRTPVIATPAGAAPELLADGGGIQVKHEDPQNMANAIIQVNEMGNSQWREMSDAAYDTAKRHTWDQATKCFENALEYARKLDQP